MSKSGRRGDSPPQVLTTKVLGSRDWANKGRRPQPEKSSSQDARSADAAGPSQMGTLRLMS